MKPLILVTARFNSCFYNIDAQLQTHFCYLQTNSKIIIYKIKYLNLKRKMKTIDNNFLNIRVRVSLLPCYSRLTTLIERHLVYGLIFYWNMCLAWSTATVIWSSLFEMLWYYQKCHRLLFFIFFLFFLPWNMNNIFMNRIIFIAWGVNFFEGTVKEINEALCCDKQSIEETL